MELDKLKAKLMAAQLKMPEDMTVGSTKWVDYITDEMFKDGPTPEHMVIGSPEHLLHGALCNIMDQLWVALAEPDDAKRHLFNVGEVVRQTLVSYADAVMHIRYPVRWNHPAKGEVPKFTTECHDHHAVTPVGYMEVANMLETSGCSKEEPYWIHSVMGAIRTKHGIQLVCPGDWIITPLPGVYQVLSDDEFQQLYM